MSKIVGLVNYGVFGNTYSVTKALEKSGATVVLIDNVADFDKVPRIVLPGVGSFKEVMEELERDGLVDAITAFNGPILGICLGMQILSTVGYEHGKTKGLGLIDAEVKPVDCSGKIPHVGFNKVDVIKGSKLFDGIESEPFYFMHSYELVGFHDVLSTTTYEDHMFVSSVSKNNIYGVQFHPEKSRDAGIKLFSNFLEV